MAVVSTPAKRKILPVNTRCSTDAGLMLGHHCRRCTGIAPTLVPHVTCDCKLDMHFKSVSLFCLSDFEKGGQLKVEDYVNAAKKGTQYCHVEKHVTSK